MNWQHVQGLRKGGQLKDAREAALAILAADPDDLRTKSEYEWILFGYVKQMVAKMSEAAKNSQAVDTRHLQELMKWMREYKGLNPQLPGMACSNIMAQLAKVGAHLPRFTEIIHWVGIDRLRPEDWQPNEYQGNSYPPLAINIARSLCRWVKVRPDATNEQMAYALEWAKRASEKAPGDDGLWLKWDMAVILRQMGEFQRASELLAQVIKAKRHEFWVWAEAGRLYRSEQPELALACFCRALECSSEPKFLVRAHRELAELLAELEEYAQASREVSITVEIRRAEGWPVGRELEGLVASQWYDSSAEGAEEPKGFYGRHSPAALALCFDAVETKPASYLGLVTPHAAKEAPAVRKLRPTPRFAVKDTEGRVWSLPGPRMKVQRLDVGAPVTVVIGRQDGNDRQTIVNVSDRSDGRPWDCTKRIGGQLRRNPKGFAFVDGAFVPPHIVESIASGADDVVAHAIWAKDRTKGEYGWRVVQINPA